MLNLGQCKPATAKNEEEDEDFRRQTDNDSDEDYDGVPCTEDIPMVEVVADAKMQIAMEHNSNSVEHECFNGLP